MALRKHEIRTVIQAQAYVEVNDDHLTARMVARLLKIIARLTTYGK